MLSKICYNLEVEINKLSIQAEITALKKQMNCCGKFIKKFK